MLKKLAILVWETNQITIFFGLDQIELQDYETPDVPEIYMSNPFHAVDLGTALGRQYLNRVQSMKEFD